MKKILIKNKQMKIFYKIVRLMLTIYFQRNSNFLHKILYFNLWQIQMNNKNKILEKEWQIEPQKRISCVIGSYQF